MLNKKAFIYLFVISGYLLLTGQPCQAGQQTESIFYNISPVGTSVYQDMGLVELRGKPARKVIFKTDVGGFKDVETIYSDPVTCYPLRVERDITMWLHEEDIIEEYNLQENKVIIAKFENGKKTQEYVFNSDAGPIHSAILLPFSLRKERNLKIGWACQIRLPDKYKVLLSSIEYITVPAGTFQVYHFTSIPAKFEIWITTDELRIPVKIKGVGGIPYALVMKERVVVNGKQELP